MNVLAAWISEQPGLLQARIHASTSVAAARIGLAEARGWNELEACLSDALQAGFEDHVGRAYACLMPCAVTVARVASAQHYLDAGMAFCVEHDRDSYRLYLIGWDALLHLRRGTWNAATEVAQALLSHPHVSAVR